MSEAKARRWALEDHKVTVDEWIDIVKGLRVFEKKAAAWDRLKALVISNREMVGDVDQRDYCYWSFFERIMNEYEAPPKPKTPLEELKEFLVTFTPGALRLQDVLSKIQELKEKK